ncbi:MAG: ABC transporter permease [Paraprevotella clara]|uniref:ABC transporter permease n=1 Tax=Paraprevotella clara TaxID=454154 RepID=UPI00399377C2
MGLWIQNFKQALRGLRHQGWQAVVSVAGLAVSIVCLTFSVNWLWTETHYDSFRPEYKDLYVVEREDSLEHTESLLYRWGDRVSSVLGEEAMVGMYRYQGGRERVYLPDRPETVFYAQELSASTEMVALLGCRVLSGSLEEVAAADNRIVLTETMARKLFGRIDVCGESVCHIQKWRQLLYTVGAVVEDCRGKSNLHYDFISPLWVEDYERNSAVHENFRILVRTSRPERTASELSRVDIKDSYPTGKLVLTPLRMFHKMGDGSGFVRAYFYQLAFVAVSLLLVLSAVVNLLAVYTSIFLGRIREYALRRSLGASDAQNAKWMFTEVLPVVFLGLLLAAMGEEWLRYEGYVLGDAGQIGRCLAVVSGFVVLLCLLGMGYPVWKMRTAYRRSFSGQVLGQRTHAWMLVVQCFASALLLFLSLGMQRQISGMIHSDLGFERNNILRLYTGWLTLRGQDEVYNYMSIFKSLPQEFRKESSSGITDAIAMPGDIFNPVSLHYISVWTEEELAEGKESYESGDKGVRYAEIPFRAMEFFGIKSKNGATFSQKAEQAGKLQVLFNGSAMQAFNVKDVRKARLYTGKMTGNEQCILLKTDYNTHYEHQALNIVGEVDIRLSDFHKGEEEMMLVGVPENHQCDFFEHDAVYIKYEEGKREDAEAAVRRVLRRFDVPEEKIMLSSLDEYISGNYKEETYYANLLGALTVFSVLITFSGVFSMLLYSLRLRRRSMAIRRVMGAGFRDVFRPQLRSYLLYVVAGGVLAYFPAALLMHKWMEYFHYGETPGVGLMAVIVCGICVVVSLIVYGQVRRCMNDKPVEVLRPES